MTVAMILCAVLLFGSLAALERLGEWHHGYAGLLLYMAPWHAAEIAGLVLLADDALQHAIQLRWNPVYRSPLHRLYADVFWPLPTVQWLNRWLDGRLR